MNDPRKDWQIHIYPWPDRTELSGKWQGDLIIDDEVVAGFTCPGGIMAHAAYGLDLLAEHIVDQEPPQ